MEEDLAPEPASENHFALAGHEATDPLPDTPSRLPLILAAAATLAWIVLVLALAGSQLTRLNAIEAVQFVAALASVPILVALVWLLTQRNSRAEAMRRATADTVQRQIQAIADATDQAVAAATRATERVAAQVQSIAEQAAVVETHVEEARDEREAADRDSFARRASLLIESLNSAAIDLTKIYAPDVTDSAWGAYLKGDRGVFTRRAVRILDAVQARDIARLYDDDAKVREQINRYIHDFEAMLRGVLAQRDGSPLGVTLLSSDMGKLYVALAQAIERLR